MSLMRFSLLFLAILIITAALSPVSAQESDFVPVTDAVLRNPDPGDWFACSGGPGNPGFCSEIW